MKTIKIYIDEAWRWPLAWPVTVWATIPRKRFTTKLFTDSKILNEKKRTFAYQKACQLQKNWKVFFWTGRASNDYIDSLWIIPSLQKALCESIFKAMKILYNTERKVGLKQLWCQKTVKKLSKLFRTRKITPSIIEEILTINQDFLTVSRIIIDWNHDFWLWKYLSVPIKTIIKWDRKVSYIWLASIVAKVERDQYMCTLSQKYDRYQFSKHKWYWTILHRNMIKKYWCSSVHRKSFCKNIITLK